MAFGTNIAKARSKVHDVHRKLKSKEQTLYLLSGNTGENKLAELITGWLLDEREYFDPNPPPTGARYRKLFIDDPTGERLSVLKKMSAVRVGSDIYSVIGKPTFTSSVLSYLFRVQFIGPQI